MVRLEAIVKSEVRPVTETAVQSQDVVSEMQDVEGETPEQIVPQPQGSVLHNFGDVLWWRLDCHLPRVDYQSQDDVSKVNQHLD